MLLNTYIILSIIAYFINKDSRCYYIVLGLYKVYNKYINKNMAAILITLFKNYKITGNLGYFMANNMDINNTCINAIF